jgi:type IV pilus assembly protein PilA
MTNNFLQTVLSKKAKSKKLNGFTLIELMVVIAIVGVLSAVGLPELLKAQDSAKDSVAQQEAVAAAKTCSMDILTGGTAYDDALAETTPPWTGVAGACVTDGTGDSTIVSTSESAAATTYTIVIEDGIPGKPVKA